MSIELNQTLDQKVANLERLADEVNDLYSKVNTNGNRLLDGGVYEGESANETREQFDEFKTNFETYYNSIKSFAAGFAEAKETHETSETETKQQAAQLNDINGA